MTVFIPSTQSQRRNIDVRGIWIYGESARADADCAEPDFDGLGIDCLGDRFGVFAWPSERGAAAVFGLCDADCGGGDGDLGGCVPSAWAAFGGSLERDGADFQRVFVGGFGDADDERGDFGDLGAGDWAFDEFGFHGSVGRVFRFVVLGDGWDDVAGRGDGIVDAVFVFGIDDDLFVLDHIV